MALIFHFFQLLIFIPGLSAFVSRTNLKLNHAIRYEGANLHVCSQIKNSNLQRKGKSSLELKMALPAEDAKIRIADLDWKVVPDIWESLASIVPNKSMLVDPVHGDKVDLTFAQCNNLITTGAAAMQKLGLLPDECVSIFAENSYKWFVADQAVMKAGGCNSVRGALAPTEELHYIYEDSKSAALIVESPQLLQQLFSPTDSDNNVAKSSIVAKPRFVIILFSKGMTGAELKASAGVPDDVRVLSYEELLAFATKEEFKAVPRDPKYVCRQIDRS